MKKTYGTAYLLSNHLTAFHGVEAHYGKSAVHKYLLKSLFLPDLVSLPIKVTDHKCSSHLT